MNLDHFHSDSLESLYDFGKLSRFGNSFSRSVILIQCGEFWRFWKIFHFRQNFYTIFNCRSCHLHRLSNLLLSITCQPHIKYGFVAFFYTHNNLTWSVVSQGWKYTSMYNGKIWINCVSVIKFWSINFLTSSGIPCRFSNSSTPTII